MVPIEPESSVTDQTSIKHPPSVTTRLFVIVSISGLIAGAISIIAGEAILKRYEGELFPALKIRPSADDLARFRDAHVYSATLIYATLGGLFGLAMGLAGAFTRRSRLSGILGATLALVVGTVVVAATTFAFVSIFYIWHDPQSEDMLLPLLTHGAIWGAVGASGGLIFGLTLEHRRNYRSTLVGGLIGGIIATLVYDLVGALAFASSKTDQPVSAALQTRAMAQLLVAVLAAFGAVIALRQSESNTSPSPQTLEPE